MIEYYIFLFDIINNELIEIQKDKNDEILDKLYFLQFRLLTEDEIQSSNNKKIQKELKSKSKKELYDDITIKLSSIEHKVPLYDIYTENIYLITKHDVYERVTRQHYRFPEQELLNKINDKKEVLSNNVNIEDKLLVRKIKKMELLLNFMKCFNLDMLFNTYVKVFYKYSHFVGKETTACKNPSFLPEFFHIKPYLTRNEVVNSALNFGLTISSDYIETEEINKLCNKISKYQISSNILLQHQHHIINNEKLGLVQYYTLQGSFFMNQYLRKMTKHSYTDEHMENLITPMWKLVAEAPAFDKSYVFYRFIGRDDYLSHIDIGDIYTENGFMSTTRDPFYRADLYKFGFILIKIKVPANKSGIALCLETISHFPEEQEIIFPPKSKFKLISKNDKCSYYHTDMNFSSKVKTRYEFEWVENDNDYEYEYRKEFNKITHIIDFLKIKSLNTITLIEKIKYFDDTFVNELGQFKVLLADKEITVMTEWYDSSDVYKEFYATNTKMGYAMYAIYEGHILFFIELAEVTEGKQIHVNYYVKYSSVDSSKLIGNDNLVKFFSSIANYFNISNVVIYASYLNCNSTLIQSGGNLKRPDDSTALNIRQRGFEGSYSDESNYGELGLIGGSYCSDIYKYLTTGVKMYSEHNILNVEMQPKFSYYDLDYLKKTSVNMILLKTDRDELYQLYDKYCKGKIDSVVEFYLWLIENNKCYLLDIFINKIDKILGENNPFRNDMYILDASTYLYNRKYISSYPINISIAQNVKRSIIKKDIINLIE